MFYITLIFVILSKGYLFKCVKTISKKVLDTILGCSHLATAGHLFSSSGPPSREMSNTTFVETWLPIENFSTTSLIGSATDMVGLLYYTHQQF